MQVGDKRNMMINGQAADFVAVACLIGGGEASRNIDDQIDLTLGDEIDDIGVRPLACFVDKMRADSVAAEEVVGVACRMDFPTLFF